MKVYAVNAEETKTKKEAIKSTQKYLFKISGLNYPIEDVLVVFPEYHLATVEGTTLEDTLIKELSLLARKHNFHIAAGFTERGKKGKYTAAILINDSGKVIGKQRKLHPASFEERKGIIPGKTKKPIKTNFGTVGFSLCKDQWYFWQNYEAEIILHLRGFGLKDPKYGDFAESWLSLDRNTAMLNKAYVIGCTGASSEYPLADIIDFERNILAMKTQEGIIEADLDLEKLRAYRNKEYKSKTIPRF